MLIDNILNGIKFNAIPITGGLGLILVALIVIGILLIVKNRKKFIEMENAHNGDIDELRTQIEDLENEATELHAHEAQIMAERDSIIASAHEQADDLLERTMERVEKSEAQIRQNRIIASNCITDARRRISDLLLDVSKRLVTDNNDLLSADENSPEALAAAEQKEKASAEEFEHVVRPAVLPASKPAPAEEEPVAEAEPAVEPEKETAQYAAPAPMDDPYAQTAYADQYQQDAANQASADSMAYDNTQYAADPYAAEQVQNDGYDGQVYGEVVYQDGQTYADADYSDAQYANAAAEQVPYEGEAGQDDAGMTYPPTENN